MEEKLTITYEEILKELKDALNKNEEGEDLETYKTEIDAYCKENSITNTLSDEMISYCHRNGFKKEEVYQIYTDKIFPLNRFYPTWLRDEMKKILGYDPCMLTLKNYRLSLGYTQKKMANILDEVETSYLNWERKKSTPRYDQLLKMQVILNISDSDMWLFIQSFHNGKGEK